MLPILFLAALVTACSGAAPVSTPSATSTPVATSQPVPAIPETAGWKTYRNEKYKFEFRYPEACQVTEHDESVLVGGRIELSVLDSEGLSLAAYVNKFIDDKTKNSGWTIESRKSTRINDKEAVTIDYRFGGTNRFGTASFIGRDAKIYVWNLTAGGFTCDEAGIDESVVSSFRFID